MKMNDPIKGRWSWASRECTLRSHSRDRAEELRAKANNCAYPETLTSRVQLFIDGEAAVFGVNGVSEFNALHSWKHDAEVQL
ncbi:hypothetical protein ACVWWK_007427 [Bradyrhizobium sp. LB9.1b]